MRTDYPVNTALKNTFISPYGGTVLTLVLVAFLSAMAVVVVKSGYRRAYIAEQTAMKQQRELRTEWMKLLLEQGTWASNHRIETVAMQEMGMKVPTADDSRLLDLTTAVKSDDAS